MYHVLCSKSEEENAFPDENNLLNFRLTRDMVVYREKLCAHCLPGLPLADMSVLTEIRQQKQRNFSFFLYNNQSLTGFLTISVFQFTTKKCTEIYNARAAPS